jgi:hypothetical protein
MEHIRRSREPDISSTHARYLYWAYLIDDEPDQLFLRIASLKVLLITSSEKCFRRRIEQSEVWVTHYQLPLDLLVRCVGSHSIGVANLGDLCWRRGAAQRCCLDAFSLQT